MLNLNSKKLLLLALTATLAAPAAQAGFFGKRKTQAAEQTPVQTVDEAEALTKILNMALPADQEAAQRQALQALAEAMVPRLTEIQKLIDDNRSAEAFSLAKSTLDEVRVKSGIDPKARLRENFLVGTTFPEGVSRMDGLSLAQQQLVILTVKNFRGGLYLDILNLSKRVSLLYIKALHLEMKNTGGVSVDDRSKIIKDLGIATIFPMPIQDKAGKIIYVFDEEVVNEDHSFMFNREIKSYLYTAKDLAFTAEQFSDYRNKLKETLVGKPMSSDTLSSNDASKNCIRDANSIQYRDSKVEAQSKCFKKYFPTTKDSNQCLGLAAELSDYDSRVFAQKGCFERFNK
jgi:hypothetical protein